MFQSLRSISWPPAKRSYPTWRAQCVLRSGSGQSVCLPACLSLFVFPAVVTPVSGNLCSLLIRCFYCIVGWKVKRQHSMRQKRRKQVSLRVQVRGAPPTKARASARVPWDGPAPSGTPPFPSSCLPAFRVIDVNSVAYIESVRLQPGYSKPT